VKYGFVEEVIPNRDYSSSDRGKARYDLIFHHGMEKVSIPSRYYCLLDGSRSVRPPEYRVPESGRQFSCGLSTFND